MNINLKSVAFSAVALICTSVVMNSAAAGGPVGETLQQRVSYADLNLDSPAGIAALDQRVHVAAVNVCSPTASRDMGLSYAPCIATATSRAISRINNPALIAYDEARQGRGERRPIAGQP